ncbi:hypothetical protein VTP01DRAFT_155 [Rhizomucor pusillus]|uniref:uncharacterized protein n=1 Tax=Rhizomucor pusillus TaxID=4840 RepID=UPI00374254A6
MASASLRQAINGVFALYKPRGWTSREATNAVQNFVSRELSKSHTRLQRKDRVKTGHGGTLDPMAEGVLIIGLGTGCKKLHGFLGCTKVCLALTAGTILEEDDDLHMILFLPKEYHVRATFGAATDTYDEEGEITHTAPTASLSREAIEAILPKYRGEILQKPPLYSALHVQGKRLYEYARENRPLPVEIKPRPVHIHRLELLEFNPPHAVFKVECGGGTYMRSLVHDMGLDLQCYAYMSGLLRTRQGDMTLENALPLVDQEGKKCLQMSSILKAMQ